MRRPFSLSVVTNRVHRASLPHLLGCGQFSRCGRLLEHIVMVHVLGNTEHAGCVFTSHPANNAIPAHVPFAWNVFLELIRSGAD
jgi:hypothetical protein